jgi:hypothetical protein
MTNDQIRPQWYSSLDCEGILHCPECGCQWNHIKDFGVEYYPTDYEAPKSEKLFLNTYFMMSILEVTRCAALRIDIQCEDGHDWSLFLHQLKGNLYLQTNRPRILPS